MLTFAVMSGSILSSVVGNGTDMTDTLTEKMVGDLPTPAKGYRIHYFPGYTVDGYRAPQGFAVRVMATGSRSYLVCYKDAAGEHRNTLGKFPDMKLARAIREAARIGLAAQEAPVIPERAKVIEAIPEPPLTINRLLDNWGEARGQNLRSFRAREGAFRRHVRPAIGKLAVADLRKSHVATMHDQIRRTAGPGMANQTIMYLSAVLNWYETRDDEFRSPNLRGIVTAAVARDRILSPDEIRTVWGALDSMGDFATVCRLLLLTGQRLREIADAHWAEIDLDDATLSIPASRYKTGIAHIVPLSAPALVILRNLPRRPGSDRLFSSMDFNWPMRKLDKLAPLPHWTLHDLRRTGRSLMARAGIRPDIAERVLGHVQGGVGSIYDRYDYLAEKRHALDVLAAEIGRITGGDPTGGNVVQLRA
jgi:integrase